MSPSELQRFVRDALSRDKVLAGCGCGVKDAAKDGAH